MIKTGDGENMDNEIHCDAVHALGDPLDPWYIVDARLANSYLEASEVLNGKKKVFAGRGVKESEQQINNGNPV